MCIVCLYISKRVNIAGLKKNILMRCGIVVVCVLSELCEYCRVEEEHFDAVWDRGGLCALRAADVHRCVDKQTCH